MGSHVFRLSVTCCLTCILCTNALGGLTLASINDDASVTDARSIFEIESSTGLIKTQTNPNGITLKDDWSKSEILRDSPLVKSVSERKGSSSSRRCSSRCSRYCVQKLGTRKERHSPFKDSNICISWFAGNQSEKVFFGCINTEYDNVDFSLQNNTGSIASTQIPVDNTNSTLLNNCQDYLDSDCNVINTHGTEENSINGHDGLYSSSHLNRVGNVEETFWNPFASATPKFPKQLLRRTNLSGYTETNFHVDPDTTGIVVDIMGNLTRAVLVIPIRQENGTRRLGIMMPLPRLPRNTRGMITGGARSLPPGQWYVKLTATSNSTYDLYVALVASSASNEQRHDVVANANAIDVKPISGSSARDEKDFGETSDIKRATNGKTKTVNKTEQLNKLERESTFNDPSSTFLKDSGIKSDPRKLSARSINITDAKSNGEEATIHDFSALSSTAFAAENITNHLTLHNNSLTSYGGFGNPQNASNREAFNGRISVADQQQKIQTRMSEVASLNEDADTDAKSIASEDASMQMTDNDRNVELSSDFTRSNDENVFGRRKMLIEVNVNSNLIAVAGRMHRVIFDVSNNCLLPVRYAIRARSTFRIYNIQPSTIWLYPRQTGHVAVDIFISLGSQDTVNTLTLFIDGTEVSEKTVYVYVQNAISKLNDDVKPTIEYSFNSNCAGKTNKNRCEKTFWSADITVQDPDSGLKRVTSTPNEIYPRATFISGTRDPVKFYYSSTCCSTTATITAIDISNNRYSRTIDVTAWDNLSEGEIAAVTLGALLLLLLLVLLIIAIAYCVRRKSSHDLPYTQRYGSRPATARSQRTSF